VGALAVWRARAGCLAQSPRLCAEPHALELAGQHRAASRLWHDRGFPYAEALALAGAGDEESLLTALALFDRLGATATAAVVRHRLRAAGAAHVPRGPRPATRRHPAGLTSRQAEILDLVADGLTNAQIAERLVLSGKTVEHHVAAVLSRLGVATRGEAVAEARRLGLEPGSQVGGAPAAR
jgi:DNA-binding CsgD family transcriptional regulator